MTTGRVHLAGLLALGALLLGCTFLGARALAAPHEPKTVYLLLAASAPFVLAAAFTGWCETRADPATLRRATILILAVALVGRLMLLPQPPDSSDVYRYVWDGRVQAAGVNPYRYVPADPALARLRDARVFPNINRATYAPTIYPPAAQALFHLVGLAGGGVTAMKAVMVGFEALTVGVVLALLGRRGLPPTRIVLYAWHPLPLFEFAGSGHIDAAAIGLMMAACLLADRGRRAGAGALLAAAAVTKFFPLVIAPALYRRWDWRAPLTAIVVGALFYLPYLSVGSRVFGFLGGYTHEEAIDDGTGFFLLGMIQHWIDDDLPTWATKAYLGAGLLILGALAAWAVWRREPARMALGACLALTVAFTVIVSPHLPWYFTWAVPFLCFAPSVSVIYLTCAAGLLYLQAHDLDHRIYSLVLYVPFVLMLAVELWLRRRELRPDDRLAAH